MIAVLKLYLELQEEKFQLIISLLYGNSYSFPAFFVHW